MIQRTWFEAEDDEKISSNFSTDNITQNVTHISITGKFHKF